MKPTEPIPNSNWNFSRIIKDLQEISLTEDEVYQELDKMGKKIDLDIGKWEIKTLQWEKG